MIYVYQPPEFVQRTERGWTKISDNLIFSAVGHEGLDIYEIYPLYIGHVKHIKNIKSFDLFPEPES